MKNVRIRVVALVVLLMVFASLAGRHWYDAVPASANTATATSTPTPTPTPIALASPVPNVNLGVSHFAYLANDTTDNGVYGGRVIKQTATAPLVVGNVVVSDTANANSVVVAPAGTTVAVGVVVGSGSNKIIGGIGINPSVAGSTTWVQINGIARVICDSSITQGTAVMVSATIAGGVTAYVAGTTDEEVGIITNSCTAGLSGDMLILR